MVAIPGSEVQKVLPALDALKVRFPDEHELINYLKRYYNDWQTRRRKDGAGYSQDKLRVAVRPGRGRGEITRGQEG